MANANVDRGPKIQTPICRVNWPSMFTPRSAEEGKTAFYSLTMMFRTAADPTADPAHPIVSITELKAAAMAILVGKFGVFEKGGWPAINPVFRNGADKKDHEGFDAGVQFISAKSKKKPALYGPQLEDIEDPNEFTAGCYGQMMIAPYWYDTKGNKGIAWSLISAQKQKDGEPIGTQASREDFTAIEPPTAPLGGAVAGADPLGGGAVAGVPGAVVVPPQAQPVAAPVAAPVAQSVAAPVAAPVAQPAAVAPIGADPLGGAPAAPQTLAGTGL